MFKAAFEAVPRSLIDAARIDGLSEWRIILRVLLPLSKPAIATNVILSFIWSWNNFLWPLLITRDPTMQTLPLGLARFLSYMEDTTGALYAFAVHGAGAVDPRVPDGAEGVHPRPHLRERPRDERRVRPVLAPEVALVHRPGRVHRQ